MNKLIGKVALVTGANGDIGSELVKELKKEGCDVFTIDREGDVNYQMNFGDISNVENMLVAIQMELPKIDYIFNVAGVGIYGNINKIDSFDLIYSLKVNVITPFILIQGLLSKMPKGSMILNIGSGMGVNGVTGRSAYCTSKFALRGLSLSLANEIEDKDICLLTLGSVMDHFGTGGIEKRKELEKQGKKYLSVGDVVKKIIGITQSTKRQKEYKYYPLQKNYAKQ